MLYLYRGEPDLALSQLATGESLAAEQRVSFIMEPLFLRGAAFCRAASHDWLERADSASVSDRRAARGFNQVIGKLTSNLHITRRQCG